MSADHHLQSDSPPLTSSIWELHKWLAQNDALRGPQNAAKSAVARSNGAESGKTAGDRSGIAVNGAAALRARSRARKLSAMTAINEHEALMHTAAHLAANRPSHPFAAILVDRTSGEILAEGVNAASVNPIAHGEIVCLTNAAQSLKSFDWKNTVLYTTAEPCCMCMSAILWCRIPQVVFGTSVETLQQLGWAQFLMSAQDVVDAAPFADCRLLGGVLEEQCNGLFRTAVSMRRPS